MEEVRVEGKTLEEAVQKASEALGVPKERLHIRVDPEHFKGEMGKRVGANTVRVVATVKRESLPSSSQADEVKGFIGGTIERMGMEANIRVEEDKEKILVQVETPDESLLIGRHGQTLDALHHILTKAFPKSRVGKRVFLDVGGYNEKREARLKETVRHLVERVRRTGRPVDTEPLNARERRIVHLAVAGTPGLGTRSHGDGEMKRIEIFLSQGEKQGMFHVEHAEEDED